MENLRPNKKRAKTAILFIWIEFALIIISLISSLLRYFMLKDIVVGKLVTDKILEENDLRENIIFITQTLVYIVSGIFFIRWFRRAYFNLHLKVSGLNHSEGWAAGYWFVPIANFYRPYQIMKELYIETNEYLKNNRVEYNNSFSPKTLILWWAYWVISAIFTRIIFQYSKQVDTIYEFILSTQLTIIDCIVSLPLCFITIRVIKNYSLMEDELINFKKEDSNNFIEI